MPPDCCGLILEHHYPWIRWLASWQEGFWDWRPSPFKRWASFSEGRFVVMNNQHERGNRYRCHLIAPGSAVPSWACVNVCVVFQMFSGFTILLSLPKSMLVRVKATLHCPSVNVCVWAWNPAMDWHLIQGAFPPRTRFSQDRLQIQHYQDTEGKWWRKMKDWFSKTVCGFDTWIPQNLWKSASISVRSRIPSSHCGSQSSKFASVSVLVLSPTPGFVICLLPDCVHLFYISSWLGCL